MNKPKTEEEFLQELKDNAEKPLMEVADLKIMKNSFALRGLYDTAWTYLPEKIQETLQLINKFKGDKDKETLAKRSLIIYLKDFTAIVEADLD